ncbi:cytochrome-c peroxidase [Massilia endophytica]|uniref:cytochrome-c peroxidase n=1 Tax=Massilia endophytica TaxID=2899220 RepID=UPI001E38FDE1|nr:cytochrome c peroxidase [Massilia endophytica]UGQ47359.1 c-type cytochrome [Massilia endophytica]
MAVLHKAACRAALLVLAALLQACGGGSGSAVPVPPPEPVAAASPLSDSAQLGELLFRDPALSASGRQSCESCHVPSSAHAPANSLAVQLGGESGLLAGLRTAPSLRYQAFTPQFGFGKDGAPLGGYNADGRASTLAAQAEGPLLAAHEMANASKAALADRVRRASYAERFRTVFGAGVFDDPAQAFERITFALQQFQRQDARFQPFDSRFDQSLAGKVQLSAAEQRGLALFNSPAKGNCMACHTSTPAPDGTPPLFTNFGYYALGVPRNAGAASTFGDLGLCGPERGDLRERSGLCGAFKVPSLRNVATRQVFFHNGAIASLRDAVRFHVLRDIQPALWYPREPYDDLPPQYRGNVVKTAPFDRRPGDTPALSESDIEDVLAFLRTLSDGYRP